MPFPTPEATGWVPNTPNAQTAQPPPEVLALLGGSFDPNRWSWDPYTSRLTDRTTGGSYDYSGLVASQNPSTLVTDLTAFNQSGGQQGGVQLPVGSTPYFGFGDSAQGYDAGLMPNSGIFASIDPNEISAYQSHANDVVGRGVGSVAALVGGAALGGALSGGSALPSGTVLGPNGLPTGAAAAAGGGVGTLSGAVPAVGASPGIGAGLGAGLTTAPNGLPTASGASGAGSAAAGLSGLDRWLPYITTGVNSILGAQAADRATDAETNALTEAIAEQRRQFDLSRQDQLPWLQAGTSALGRLQDSNAFQASPGYQFRRDEGLRDINQNFAARGLGQSGNALRALTEYNSGIASDEYGNWWNQQAGLAGVGQNTAMNLGSQGQNTAANVANLTTQRGQARSAGIIGKYGSYGSGLTRAIDDWRYRRGF